MVGIVGNKLTVRGIFPPMINFSKGLGCLGTMQDGAHFMRQCAQEMQ
jgi:hypothetical protein